MSGYFDTLYSASYNGAPFYVRRSHNDFGRRIVTHKYPFRDTVFPEDLGRRPREFEIVGFLVGDDVLSQFAWMQTVCELKGTGVLIHPILGIQNVQLLGLGMDSDVSHGRELRITFKFIEGGQRLFAAITNSTGANTTNALTNMLGASVGDFINGITSAISVGEQAAIQAAVTAATLIAVAQAAVKSASNIAGSVASLPGPFGRNAGGATGSSSGSILGTVSSVGGAAAVAVSTSTQLGITAQNISNTVSSSSAFQSIVGAL